MRAPGQHPHTPRRYLWPMLAGIVMLFVLLAWSLGRSPRTGDPASVEAAASAGPPWRYGSIDARFTLIGYADLECPYCQAYFPVLKRWIDANHDVNWQWHHLPLPMHEPAATQAARLAECAGETGGQEAFWDTVAWIYQHARAGGRGLPPGIQPPGTTPELRKCLASARPDAVIRAQIEKAALAGINATPMLRVIDNHTGRALLLPGAVEGDALLSAIDLLASSSDEQQWPKPCPRYPRCLLTPSATCPGSRDLQGYGAVQTALIGPVRTASHARTSIVVDGGCQSSKPDFGFSSSRPTGVSPHRDGSLRSFRRRFP
ncbi:DsbA family protein [Stutzerimonas balearica]|jgi:protein-disulfide isomerase